MSARPLSPSIMQLGMNLISPDSLSVKIEKCILIVYSKPHPSRYTFILCRHKDISSDPLPNVNPDSLRSYYEGSPGDLGNPSQDIIDRMKFDTQHFIERNGLEVVAATYMLVEGNLKSAVKSVGLTAQGLGDKVVGK